MSDFRKPNRINNLTADGWAAQADVADERDVNDELLDDLRDAMAKLSAGDLDILRMYYAGSA